MLTAIHAVRPLRSFNLRQCGADAFDMAEQESVPIADLSEVRFRIATVAVGVKLLLVVVAAGIAYALATWDSPERSAITILFGGLGVAVLLISRLPAERIVRSRFGEAFFLAWSSLSVLVFSTLVAIDGGARSPLALLLFLPVVFAALSYPLRSVVVIGALTELSFVAANAISDTTAPVPLAFFTACLSFTAVLCAWQARIHERRREELQHMSRADSLTGCLNRRGFKERVAANLDEGLRIGRPMSIVLLDLNGFKQVNDTQGHAAGDELLRWTVERMRDSVRPMDSVGRLGGDEFAILLPGAGHNAGLKVAARVHEALEPHVTASVGIASFPTDGVELDELLAHADTRLYAAKHGDGTELSPGQRELSWAAALAHAVDMRLAAPDAEHSGRVAFHAAAIGQRLGWSGADVALLRMAAMLHDVGKVSIPDRILRKPGPLSANEQEEIRRHPVAGAELIARVDGLEPILPWIRHSHEHFDGSGYPDGLSGEAIPQASRILLVADAFDAMTNDRPYRPARALDEALAELQACAGTDFDPECVAKLEEHLREDAGRPQASSRHG
jgi:diguanylate cyclase (GGDEF)-like protein/putative nucleotidyltransferase with HDIG domain